TTMNAANEVAVASFLSGGIGFLDIAAVVEETLERTPNGALRSLEDVHATDETARLTATDVAGART
ncbi:MAG: 1-deoxy-D-xylulose-5-phosphate reductoisomerase, partial [Rhodospirillaceae bacterium]